MSEAFLAVGGVLCGCQANVFLLELITVGSPNTLYFLTFMQYVVVAVLSLPFVFSFRIVREERRWISVSLRPMRISLLHKSVLAAAAWLMSVSSNMVFGLHISVPLHATFRSSSLLLNMLTGYIFLGKYYTLPQILCALVICGGLIALTVEKSRNLQDTANATITTTTTTTITKATLTAEEHFWWICGLVILTGTTFLSTGLGIFQEYMYETARRKEKDNQISGDISMTRIKKIASSSSISSSSSSSSSLLKPTSPPMWAEALFFSHVLAIPLFFSQPGRLVGEFASISPGYFIHFFFNAVTQFICVLGVYVLNDKTSAFTLILILTLRKLFTFVISVVYFGHYRHFSIIEWAAMIFALMAGALYPLLPKSHANSLTGPGAPLKKNA
ncbi:UAA transporter [Trypanosoma melophagium]|uniref:UAA transporter n=1 Tax=Trypanosoma melophagium TaxID=715481 RepID=UPI00351AB09C|nr:UAA transporter [Trypanosoma melophagium]